MPVDLVRRLVKGTQLTAADHDGNLTQIEAALETAEVAVAEGQTALLRWRGAHADFRDGNGVDATGNNDSTSGLNALFLQAKAAGLPVLGPPGTFRVGTLRWPSGVEIVGSGTVHTRLVSDGTNGPILASKSWFAADAHAMVGNGALRHLTIRGSNDQNKTAQRGVLLRDYWSVIDDVLVEDTGGPGVEFTHRDDAGVAVASLVDNALHRVRVHNCRALSAVLLGETDNPALTDGHIHDLRIWGHRTGTHTGVHLFIGHAAGWQVTKVHTFAFGTATVPPTTGIHLHRPWNAYLGELYIENAALTGIYAVAGTGPTTLVGVRFIADSLGTGGSALFVDRVGASDAPIVRLDGLQVLKSAATPAVRAVSAGAGTTISVIGPPDITGAGAAAVAPYLSTGTPIGVVRVPNTTGGWATVP